VFRGGGVPAVARIMRVMILTGEAQSGTRASGGVTNSKKVFQMSGKFETYAGENGQHYFRLKAGNGEVILSSQGYKAKDDCANGVASVRKNCQREGAFETKTASDGRHYFVLKATNGQVVGQSQMYKTESGCANGIESVKKNAPEAPVAEA